MSWKDLSISEKAKVIKAAVQSGIQDLKDIQSSYDSWSSQLSEVQNNENYHPYSSGALTQSLYNIAQREEKGMEPSRDYVQSERWANAHGYFPDARGHRDDRVKKPLHPTHPSRGSWNGDYFQLTDKGLEESNHTLFGMSDGGQDPQAIMTYGNSIVLPEITVTPNGNYVHNTYDNIKYFLYKSGGTVSKQNKNSQRQNQKSYGKHPSVSVSKKYAKGGIVNKYDGETKESQNIYKKINKSPFKYGLGLAGIKYALTQMAQKKIQQMAPEVKQRLYNNLHPFNYNKPIERLWDAVILNKKSANESDEMLYDPTYLARKALFAKYLGLNDKQAEIPISDYIEESPYKPPHAKPGEIYYRYNLQNIPEYQNILDSEQEVLALWQKKDPEDEWHDTVQLGSLNVGDTTFTSGHGLGDYTVGVGKDDSGYYYSYYDEWNLNPFKGYYAHMKIPGISAIEDLSMGLGTPIKMYDRKYWQPIQGTSTNEYLDDKGNPTTLLPEISVYPPKTDQSVMREGLFNN